MANHAQAIKRHRQSLERRTRNRHYRTRVKNAVKKLHTAIDEKQDEATIQGLYREAASIIDKVAKKGVIKSNTAARRIGRLAKAVTAGPRPKIVKSRKAKLKRKKK